jgi:YegS/Rv2252/BmrU family lipid kinase
MKQTIFIVNPIAGNKKYLKFIGTIEKYISSVNSMSRILFSEYPGHAIEISKQYQSSSDIVVAVGGDGTLNEVLQGQVNSEATVGIFPCGSGNDNSASFNITIENAIETLKYGKLKKVPLAEVNGKVFIGVAGCGFDTEVNNIANKFPSFLMGSKTIYILAILIACFKYVAPEMNISLDGDVLKGKYLLMAVGHGDRYGGGMLVAPKADRYDGLLDVCIVNDLNRIKLILSLSKLLKGKHLLMSEVIYRKVKEVKIQGDVEISADGEFRTNAPATYNQTGKYVNLLVPKTH